jgi:FkbM family methyltransferase
MLNLFKCTLYKFLVRINPPEQENHFLNVISSLIYSILGAALYKNHEVSFHVTPINLLDKFWLLDRHINPFVESALILNTNSDKDLFVDIGANVGYTACLAAKHFDVTVIAFEPSQRELHLLYKNILANNLTNIVVYHRAIFSDEKTSSLSVSDESNTGQNSFLQIRSEGVSYVKEQECNGAALPYFMPDSMLQDTIVVKIDIEGGEVDAIKGMEEKLIYLRKAIFVIEISPSVLHENGYDFRDIYNIFSSHGFNYQYGIMNPEINNNSSPYEEVFYHPHNVSNFIFKTLY